MKKIFCSCSAVFLITFSASAQDLIPGLGVKGWFLDWENDAQGFKSDSGVMYGFSGLLKYKRMDMSITWLDGDFDLQGENLDASREELRVSLGFSATDYINLFLGWSDRSGDFEGTRTETVSRVVGSTNGVPIVVDSTESRTEGVNFELQGVFLGASLNYPLGIPNTFSYVTASLQPFTSIDVGTLSRDEGFGANFELGLGFARDRFAAKVGYRFEQLDNSDDYDETLKGLVFVASVAL